ncbi:MAG: hypothetical protein GF403_05230 [Candidatus Coatesbacteria bacterium]|jgi:biopolymer transport protein ExbD|nr:hypothetical protein [Candidatus Coatesbacteria bacterium]
MAFKRKSRVAAEIPSSSMSDIAFLLLVFFMTTTIFNVEKGIRVQLPGKGEPTQIKADNVVTVRVRQDGSIYLDAKQNPMEIPSLGQLKDELEKRLAANEKLAVIFEVHPEASYDKMIDVFDEIKRANIVRLALKIR